MLHFRNTYKNCKIMILYGVLTIISLIIACNSLLMAFIPKFRVISIILCIIFTLLFVINFFLLIMKNNNYKLKNYFRLSLFNKEYKKIEHLYKGNKKTIKNIRERSKDYFLQFGEISLMGLENNDWNDWIDDANAFSYKNAQYAEKLSYLIYVLYDSCYSGAGLECVFRWLSYEPFTKEEIIEILTKNEFLSEEFKSFIVKIIKEFDKNKEELFAKYELEDNKIFFSFENMIYDCAKWLACNRHLLSSCAGIYLYGNTDLDIYQLFLSKDYKKVVFIYKVDHIFKVGYKEWDRCSENWNVVENGYNSHYDSVETAFNDIKSVIKDYIEILI